MKSKIKIEWLTKSKEMLDAYNCGLVGQHIRGGRIYELLAIDVLKNNYQVSINKAFVKTIKLIKYLFQNQKSHIKSDICVIDPYILALGKFSHKTKNIAIIHHIDEELFKRSVFSRFFYFNLKRNLKKMDAVVVVSEVWKTFLNNHGVENVKVIYNAFDITNFEFSDEEKDAFKKKYNLNNVKPIVYIGPNSSGKGVVEVLKVIDQEAYELIATGKTDVDNKNVKTFFFSDSEFPLFLASCNLVLCMSTMKEGWNRIAHEALLTKTPVIGSGSGGMQELLEKSGQTIVKDINNLNDSIKNCLENSNHFSEVGYKYTSKFDLNYFKTNWENLIEEISC